ncbi:MAG: NTP transferase domain-containing protein, partial [Saprospiraceae bacterium]|nr:NTP transferase domain-containing protein [Saprospiraceae bacterium]
MSTDKKISLLVLAAGMGSRYGGLKQLDELGPAGETILEYSIYDAIQAGFSKVVFVVRDFFLDEFRSRMEGRFGGKIELDYVCQEVNPTFEDIEGVVEREKPWGTSHAVLTAKEAIAEPFAVVNADDYYGQDSFAIMADFLREQVTNDHYAMVGYILDNTLSDTGHVNRGVCEVDDEGNLVTVEEVLKIRRDEGKVVYGEPIIGTLSSKAVVSMNFWGFPASIFVHLEKGFHEFVSQHRSEPRAEYFIPLIIDDLIKNEHIELQVLTCNDRWYGVTYSEDAERVKKAFRSFVQEGKYPHPLLAG